jgi:hypothetical protein
LSGTPSTSPLSSSISKVSPCHPRPPWLGRIPFGGERLAAAWTRFAALDSQQRLAELTPYVQTALQWFAVKAGSVGMMLLQFLVTAIISAIVLTSGEHVRDALLLFAERLAGRQGREAALQAARAIRGVVLGVVVTALMQAAIGGVGLFIAGLPAAALLTAVMLFLCLAQLGPMLVLVPAVIWLYWSGGTMAATILLVITVIAGALDNFVRPWLIKRGANLPLVLIFAGVIGGCWPSASSACSSVRWCSPSRTRSLRHGYGTAKRQRVLRTRSSRSATNGSASRSSSSGSGVRRCSPGAVPTGSSCSPISGLACGSCT